MYRIGEEELEELRKVISSKKLFRKGDPAQGHQQEVDRFEQEWAQTIGTNYAILLSGGGTAALICALAALGIGPGDEVIVPAYTWMATATAALSVGAIPVIAEVDETLALDPLDVENKLSSHTKAIIPVHMAGRPANLETLLAIAHREKVFLVEDASQANGGSYKGKRLGSYGDCSAFSFNDFKLLSCGEGGALVTNDRVLYDRARIFHDSLTGFPNFAQDLVAEPFVGLQFRASEIMGAIMRVQLQRLDGILTDLRRIGRLFDEELKTELNGAPGNDAEGDCRVVVAYQFEDAKIARAFATSEGVHGWLPVDTGRHVYNNWTALLERRVGHHPDWNPLNHPKNQGLQSNYSADMCPRTLNILSRTVYISLHPDWGQVEVERRIAACRTAAQNL